MMNDFDKRRELAQKTHLRETLRRIKRGAGAIRHNPDKALAVIVLYTTLYMVWVLRYAIMSYTPESFLSRLLDLLMGITLVFFAGAATTGLCWLFGGPLRAGKVQDDLLRIGLVNAAGEAPTLLSISKDKDNPKNVIMEFISIGLPLSKWLDCADAIQAALNVTVADIRQGKDEQHTLLYTAPSFTVWKILPWYDSLLPLDHSVLLLGESPLGPVTIDLAKIPHILLGGSTGSGKTVLLKLMLRQAVCHNMEVHIADFKGGVDFGRWFRDCCDICYDMETLLEMLGHFVDTLKERKKLFRLADCANIDQYNAKVTHHLRRMVFACDEVAELLDKSGKSKTQKEVIDQVTDKLSILARQGRAFGLHLFLSTQRPEANILPGQIRSNIDFKVCGRADSILSDIIIDSTAAADLIPKDAQGRFVLNDVVMGKKATVFQGYLLPDRFM